MRLILATTLALVLVAAGCSGSNSDTSASSGSSETTQDTAIAQSKGDFAGLVDIGGGRKICLECRGTGSPTLVLISGGDGARDGWSEALDPTDPVHEAPTDLVAIGKGDLKESESAVFPSLTKFTRVCAYSRPGTGLDGPEISTPVPQPQVLPYFW